MAPYYTARWERVAACFVLLTLINFGLFVAGTLFFHGDAVSGYAGSGHYYLAEKHRVTEVSRTVFLYSRWHVWSVWLTWPVAMLLAWLIGRRRKRSRNL